jgi:serine/threonine-protein kinase RsbW
VAVTDETGDPPAGEAVIMRAWAVLGMPARAELLGDVREGLRQWMVALGLTSDQEDVIILCVDEAASNAVEHAYAGGTGTIDIQAAKTVSPCTVRVTVSDRGAWRKPSKGPIDRGRGLALIRGLTGQFDMHMGPTGTTVTMTWVDPARVADAAC